MSQPEFDNYSASYKEMLKDPLCDSFAGSSDFFHVRKRDLIRAYFRKHRTDSKTLRYLDVGCGKGDLASLLVKDFAHVAGCDPSGEMLKGAQNLEVRVQEDPGKIPFDDGQFDFATAVCVYHHVPPPERAALTAEVARVLRPGGVFAIIEHNPWNPATRIIVKRSPVDQNAVLLSSVEARSLLQGAGLPVQEKQYFLYLPEGLYNRVGAAEGMFKWLPLGGQYTVFGQKPR
jgi:SAM-dependent methyltransferase